jgi:hypothetical protein
VYLFHVRSKVDHPVIGLFFNASYGGILVLFSVQGIDGFCVHGMQVALKLVRNQLQTLGMGPENPLTVEEVPVVPVADTATGDNQAESLPKTSSDVVIVEVTFI